MTRALRPDNWQEARRLRAWELKQAGWRQQAIATALGVSKGAVSHWMKAADSQGPEGLRTQPRTGRPCELAQRDLLKVPELLSHGAEAYGFRGEVWTCARVAKVIEGEFGVRYHKDHVSRLLKQLRWTPQQPIERASQRDEALITAWRTDRWPALKKRQRGSGAPWFLSMNRASTCCRLSCGRMPPAVRHRCCEFSKRGTTCRL